MLRDRIKNWLAEHPKVAGVLFTGTYLVLRLIDTASDLDPGGGSNTYVGP